MAMEILLLVGGCNVDEGAEVTLINANINSQESDMGLRSVQSEVDGITTVESFKEGSEGVWTM